MKDVLIVNKKDLDKKLRNFKRDGLSNLHILSDFDGTLLKCWNKGEKINSLISRLRNGKYLTPEYARRAQALFEQYHPIEIDSTIPLERKIKKMREWWTKHWDLLIEYKFNQKTIREYVSDMIKNKKPEFRSGISEFVYFARDKKIPIVILTAGLEDLVTEYLVQKDFNFENINVIGNKLHYDKRRYASRIDKIMHVFSKDERHIQGLSVYKELLNRKNVLLLGDGLGDLGMIKGFPYENLISIGFVNEPTEAIKELYMKHFDVLILNDGSLQYLNSLLKKIPSHSV
ncbi:haloacid dehalogenase-like hydrolase [Candidatus Pacearchaeota archaeon]|nr:haloacid dehalogenase-like hydrolase [Candidatus Pacearchaeota archaeon]